MTMIKKLIGTDRNAFWKSPCTGEMILLDVYRKSFTNKHTYIEYNNLDSVLPIKNSNNIIINVFIIEIFDVLLFSDFFSVCYILSTMLKLLSKSETCSILLITSFLYRFNYLLSTQVKSRVTINTVKCMCELEVTYLFIFTFS